MAQARKTQFSLLINARKLCLPIDIQFDMFENVVCPILLYGMKYGVLAELKYLKYSIGIS